MFLEYVSIVENNSGLFTARKISVACLWLITEVAPGIGTTKELLAAVALMLMGNSRATGAMMGCSITAYNRSCISEAAEVRGGWTSNRMIQRLALGGKARAQTRVLVYGTG